jgi:hypothetical protein
MKLNPLSLFACGAALMLGACDDTLTDIGSSIRPGGDILNVEYAVFETNSSTFLADSIYIRTSTPLLGEINDKLYGTIRSDYASSFYGQGFTLDVWNDDTITYQLDRKGDSLIDNRLDSAVLMIYYSNYVGDSLTPMAATVYPLSTPLPTDKSAFYSNVDFSPYIDMTTPLGSAGYTGKDMTVTDSIRELDSYTPAVRIMLDESISDRFLNALRKTPEVFTTQTAFENFFPGVCIKNTFGNGTLLQVDMTRVYFYYRTLHHTTSSTGDDSTYVVSRATYMSVAPDVVQLNSLKNPIQAGGNPTLLNNDTATYVTSPGDYFTEIKFPVGSIIEKLNANTKDSTYYLNGVNFSLQANKPTSVFSQDPPTYMLLVEKAKMNEFFEDNKLPDSKVAVMTSFTNDSTNNKYYYNFGNINTFVENMADRLVEIKGLSDVSELTSQDSITLAVVPVQPSTNSSYSYTYRVSNYFLPGGISFKGKSIKQTATMIYTRKDKPTTK